MNFLCSIPTKEKEIIKSLLKDCITMFNNYAIENNLSPEQIKTLAFDIYNANNTYENPLFSKVYDKLFIYYKNKKAFKFIKKELLGNNPSDGLKIIDYYRHNVYTLTYDTVFQKVDYQTALILYAIIRYNYTHRISFSQWKNIIAPQKIKSLNYNYYKDNVIYETDFCTYS